MPKGPNFQKTVFDNGLTLVTECHPHFRSLSIGIWVKVGTRHEGPADAGVSHFLEHMLFKGTKNRTALEIAREVDQVGGEFNAFTAREYTCFHILLLNRDLDLGLDILSDVVLNSDFDAEELDRERKVILQEIAMVEESHEEMAHDIYFELIYGNHGLGRPILGTESSIRKMKRAEVISYFRKHYRPDQLILSVSGDVSHDEVKRRLRPLSHGKWPGRPAGRPSAVAGLSGRGFSPQGCDPAPAIKPGMWWIQRPSEQVHLIWGVEGPRYGHKDRFAAFLLNVFLGGGMSSSLFQEIREKNGLAYTVYSSLSPFADSGVFSIYAATGMGQIPLCLKLIEDCVGVLQKKLLTKDELQVIKDNLKGSILLSADSVESRMTSIARNEIFMGRNYTVDEVCKLVDHVRAEDIRRVARELLKADQRSVLALGPKPSKQIVSRLRPAFPARYAKKT